MRAPLPNAGFRCPHCKVSLRYVPVQWGFTGVLILLFLPVIVAVGLATRHLLGTLVYWPILFLGIAVALWLPFEWVVARRHRAKSRLSLK